MTARMSNIASSVRSSLADLRSEIASPRPLAKYMDVRFETDVKLLLGKMDRMEALMEKLVDLMYVVATSKQQETPVVPQTQPTVVQIENAAVEEEYFQVELDEEELSEPEEPKIKVVERTRVPQPRSAREPPSASKRPRPGITVKKKVKSQAGPFTLPLIASEIPRVEAWLEEGENYDLLVGTLKDLRKNSEVGDKKLLREFFADDIYDVYTCTPETQPKNCNRLDMKEHRVFTDVMQEVFECEKAEAEEMIKRESYLGRKRNLARCLLREKKRKTCG